MGSVTHPERARDTVEMARLTFGAEFVDKNTVITSLINANSPMVWDGTMLGALKVYARANQACIVTPFILAGAMSPVTAAGTLAQVLAEVLAGAATTQLARPGRAGHLRRLRQLDLHAVRRPHLRHAGADPGVAGRRPARPAPRHSLPHRRLPLRLQDPRCPGRL